MVDFHTHILPGMDDGAATVADSLAMLARLHDQGVDTVCLTSHFLQEEPSVEDFLRRRSAAWSTFSADGLYFLGPRYAPEWGMPERTPAFDWLPAPGVF